MGSKETVTKSKSNIQLINESLPDAMNYPQYRDLVSNLVKGKKTTGSLQTDTLINYTRLNHRRMMRWDKSLKFSDEAIAKIVSVKQKITWLVLTESWCGDASPALPVIHKITMLNPNISLSILLRDDYLEIMNRYLTWSTMSIPKLIAINDLEKSIMGTWGPRSTNATRMVVAYKAKYGQLTPVFKQDLQVWYNKDKGQSILEDLLKLLPLE